MTTSEKKAELVEADARNRAVRSFLTGLSIDVAVAIALAITAVLVTADGWGSLEWAAISFSFAKSVLQAVAAYVLRKFLDKSGIRTPLPPSESGS